MLATLVIGVIKGSIYGLLAIGLVLVYKGTRVLNFAQAEIGTFALFVGWWLIEKLHTPWVVGAAVAIVAATVIGLAFEFCVVRRMVAASRLAIAVATVGLFLLLFASEALAWKTAIAFLPAPITGIGPNIFGLFLSPWQAVAIVTVVVLSVGLAAFLRFTDFGIAVQAAAQDPEAVRLMGIRLSRVSLFIWGAAAASGAIAALLIEPIRGNFAPGFMIEIFIFALAAALVGGLENLVGAFVGGILLGVVEAAVVRYVTIQVIPGFQFVVVMILILLTLLFFPSGILGRRARTT